jgi:hypothetical protein
MATNEVVASSSAAKDASRVTPVSDGGNSLPEEDNEEEFQTIQEKVDSWQNDSDGLKFGFFRVDPPKPFGNLS